VIGNALVADGGRTVTRLVRRRSGTWFIARSWNVAAGDKAQAK